MKDDIDKFKLHLKWQWIAIGILAGLFLASVIIGVVNLVAK